MILVRLGSGFVGVRDFIHQYLESELEKLQKADPVVSLKNEK